MLSVSMRLRASNFEEALILPPITMVIVIQPHHCGADLRGLAWEVFCRAWIEKLDIKGVMDRPLCGVCHPTQCFNLLAE
ncbi:MAG: hypothetical protein CM1200mP4_5090 [Rhodospirillaceae bacterium]|nr:MAG: hypothetical protein CM1200mP4_5090 [Rhodospirillaceae bacterium]